MNLQLRLAWALLLLGLFVFLVMLMWTLNMFFRPGHAAGVFSHFYTMPHLESTLFLVFGAFELLLLLAFVLGFARCFIYAVVILHGSVDVRGLVSVPASLRR